MTRTSVLIAASVLAATANVGTQSPSEPIEKDATVRTFKLHYREAGRGAPVILLHGLGSDGERWGPTLKGLSSDFRMIALDELGNGKSDKPLINYHAGVHAEFLAGFMKALNIPKASIVGNSVGGGIAIYFAVHYPQLVDKLVLVDGGGYRATPDPTRPPPVPDPAAARQAQRRGQLTNAATTADMREFLRILYHDKSLVTDQMVESALLVRFNSSYATNRMLDTGGQGGVSEEEARAIKAPTLIIWGKYDELSNPNGADRLTAVIAGSRKVLIDNAGHLPQLEQPAEFNRTLLEFLKASVGSTTP